VVVAAKGGFPLVYSNCWGREGEGGESRRKTVQSRSIRPRSAFFKLKRRTTSTMFCQKKRGRV